MNGLEDQDVGFSTTAEEELDHYRPLSRLALGAGALGLASFLALVHPLLWLVPLVAVPLALAGIRVTQQHTEEVSGRRVAVLGLVLALFFGGWATSRYFSFHHWLASQGRRHSDQWLDLVLKRKERARNIYEAYELHLPYFQRRPPETNLAALYGTLPDVPQPPDPSLRRGLQWEPKEAFQEFWSQSPKLELYVYGPQADSRIEFIGFGEVSSVFYGDGGFTEDTVVVHYLFHYRKDGQPQQLPLAVWMQRRWTERNEQHWMVKDVGLLHRA